MHRSNILIKFTKENMELYNQKSPSCEAFDYILLLYEITA